MNEKVKSGINKAYWYGQRRTLGSDRMKLKPYPKYKDSGIKWIGKIPEGWKIRKIKYTSTITMGQSPNAALINDEAKGIPFFQGKADFCELYPKPKSWIEQPIKIARRNDILITVRAPVGALNISNQTCCIGRGLAAIRFHNYKYLYYNLHIVEEPLNAISSGSTFEAIAFDDLKSMIIPLSENVEQQTTIASFLDKKTARIDALIEKDKRLIELLKEKRTALINHAVTKGLDPNVKLKDSGIPWIGEIPEGWEVIKLKFIADERKEKERDGKEKPLLGLENIESSTTKIIEYNSTENIEGESLKFEKNSVLFGKLRPYLAKVTLVDRDGCCTSELIVYKSSKKILPKFLMYNLVSKKYIDYVNSLTYGVKMPRADPNTLSNIKQSIPPFEEQQKIVEYLDKATSNIDKTIKIIEKKIKLLEEYKKSLIHHVVTGKADVRKSEV